MTVQHSTVMSFLADRYK